MCLELTRKLINWREIAGLDCLDIKRGDMKDLGKVVSYNCNSFHSGDERDIVCIQVGKHIFMSI